MTAALVYLALGTNLGERAANLEKARQELEFYISIEKISYVYETTPWGVIDQPAYLNQVLIGTTELPPVELLKAVKGIEVSMGRVPTIRYGPRLIDIDILLYDDLMLNTPELTLPHPRMSERAFVLVPLLEIAPKINDPLTHERYSAILTRLGRGGVTKWEGENA